MGPKRARVNERGGASSSNPPRSSGRSNVDRARFVSSEAQERYLQLKDRPFIEDRGMEIDDLRHPRIGIPSVFEPIREQVINRGWKKFVDITERNNQTLALEFFANWPEREDEKVKVRGVKVPVSTAAIHAIYDLPTFTWEEQPLKKLIQEKRLNYDEIPETLGYPSLRFHEYDGEPYQLYRCELNPVAKAWQYFMSARLVQNKHYSDAQIDRLKFVYAIMKGFNLNVGDIIRQSFDTMVEGSCGGGLGLADIITTLCEAHGVPQYSYDTKAAPQHSIDMATVFRFKPPHPHGQQPARRNPPAEQQEEREENEQWFQHYWGFPCCFLQHIPLRVLCLNLPHLGLGTYFEGEPSFFPFFEKTSLDGLAFAESPITLSTLESLQGPAHSGSHLCSIHL
uniref:Putative plant transposon protein domain-containing protein n=1 Tax=Cannabis sativa TaxID=3483 RepID=A0A803NJE1_CANSA